MIGADADTSTLLAAVGDRLVVGVTPRQVVAALAAASTPVSRCRRTDFRPGARPGALSTDCAARQVDSSTNADQVPLPTISVIPSRVWLRNPALRGFRRNCDTSDSVHGLPLSVCARPHSTTGRCPRVTNRR